MDNLQQTDRRGFLGAVTTGAASIGLAALFQPFQAQAAPGFDPQDADAWFQKLKGKKHSIVFDTTEPHQIFPFAWPRVFLMTNAATGTPAKDCGVVVVLRHGAIPYAFQDHLWAKYKFSEAFAGSGNLGPAFQAADAADAAQKRNPLWNTHPDDFKVPGIGSVPIGIKELQADGVMFCVCQAAMSVNAHAVGMKMGMDGDAIFKDWVAGLIPGIQMVPSGVWAVGRAQENGCKYCFVG